ncbi:actin binding protein [Coemansia sp. BCRC 34301]|nr:actin binding protein [Coemansia sp. BCRC 34301]
MSSNVDLSVHAKEILSTHQRIVSNDRSICWAVYGFDRGGNALNVQAQGGGDLEELAEEFDDGKVQFGFVRVEDPNTRLPKFVFISWCGQGVPVFRKGLVSSQVGDVQKMLSGSHVTVIAHCADDIQASEIMDKVERSSGAQYSYHTQPKRQPPAPAAKPAFGAGSGTAFKKGATYGAPTVTKNASWSAAAAAAKPPLPSAPAAAKPGYLPKLTGGAPPTIGGTKPLFGGASSGGRPVSSLFGAGRSGPSSAASPTKPLYQASLPASPPSKSPVPEPARSVAPPATAYKSQQEERQAELDALRRGSRGQSPASVSRGATPTLPPLSAGSRLGAGTPTEPSAQFTQADQTKNELEMLRSRRLLNSSLGGSSGPAASDNEAAERKAELEALRRSRGGSQTLKAPSPAPPTHSWKQAQSPSPSSSQQQLLAQQQREEEEEERRRRQREEEEEEQRRHLQQQRQQKEEDERRQRQQQQKEEDERRLHQQEQDAARAAEAERQRSSTQPAASSRGPLARAVYDYDAEADDELAFKEGEIIYSIDQLDPGWWAGESEDGLRHGVFPANFVEMIEDVGSVEQVLPARSMPPPPPAAPVAPPPPPMAPIAPPAPPMAPPPPPMAPMAPPAPPMAPPGPSLPPRGPPSETVPTLPPRGGPPLAPPPPPAAPMAPPPPPPMLPPRGGPPAPPPPPPVPAAAPQQDLGENYATAVYDYDAAEEGELSFKDGEIITHIEFASADWWEGVNTKGECGLFPANYVALDSQ